MTRAGKPPIDKRSVSFFFAKLFYDRTFPLILFCSWLFIDMEASLQLSSSLTFLLRLARQQHGSTYKALFFMFFSIFTCWLILKRLLKTFSHQTWKKLVRHRFFDVRVTSITLLPLHFVRLSVRYSRASCSFQVFQFFVKQIILFQF